MKRIFTLGLPVFAIIAMVIYWYVGMGVDNRPQQISALEKTGNECELISEKAALPLPEALPFQKLEKAGRKARVFETCMKDRAYIENPDWVKLAQPIARENAQTQHISYNEAYENLRRQDMLKFKVAKGELPYWVMPQNL